MGALIENKKLPDITKEEVKLFIEEYMVCFDEAISAGIVLAKRLGGVVVDESIAKIVGTALLRDRKIARKIDDFLVKNITKDRIKLDAYKLSRKDRDGRTKVKALELIAKIEGYMSGDTVNNFNGTFTWQQIITDAVKQKRIVQLSEEQRNEVPTPLSEIGKEETIIESAGDKI